MKSITIATIRENASSLVVLNEGYNLYQKKSYKNLELKFSSYREFTIEAKADFDDGITTTLTVNDQVSSSCSCSEKSLCKHSVCLFFIIKDKINEIEASKLPLDFYFKLDNANSFIQSFIDDQKTYFDIYHLCPIICVLESTIKISLRISNRFNYDIIENPNLFLDNYHKNEIYNYGKLTVCHNKKAFSPTSNELISLLEVLGDKTDNWVFNNEYLSYFFYIYKNHYFYVRNNENILMSEFSSEEVKINLYYSNYTLKTDFNYKIINGFNDNFIFNGSKFYVLDSVRDKKLISILSLKRTKDNVVFTFDKETDALFYANVYDGLENYIRLDNKNEIIKVQVKSKINYERGKIIISYERVFTKNNNVINLDIPKTLKEHNYEGLLYHLGLEKNDESFSSSNPLIIGDLIKNFPLLKEYGPLYINESLNKIKKLNTKEFEFKVDIKSGVTSVFFENLKYSKEELLSIIDSYKLKQKYVKLKNDDILELDDSVGQLNLFLGEVSKSIDDLYSPIYINTFNLYKLNSLAKFIDNNNDFEKFIDELCNYDKQDIEINNKYNNLLRPYQITAYKWLKTLYKYSMGGILADDMGLGKTIEIISFISSVNVCKPILVVSPTSLIFNWESEIKKFADDLEFVVIYGSIEERQEMIRNTNRGIIITSYEGIRIDYDYYKDKEYSIIIADEAQYLKNPSALKTISMKGLKSEVRYALTGTPIENNLLDIWSIFDFVLPGYLGMKKDFINKYSTPVQSQIKSLSALVMPFILRRNKNQVLDLLPKIENYCYAVMDNNQAKYYDSLLLKAKNEIALSKFNITNVLSTITRLREFVCEPKLVIDNYEYQNAKLNLLMEIINESVADGHRILLFSSFSSLFPYIEKKLIESDIKYFIITGRTKAKERIDLVNDFNNNSEIKIFLISLKAGGNGLNLVGADTVIHYDPWWNIAAMNQATDRAYRFGQTKEVHIIKMVVKGSIEEKIIELQEKKKKLTEEVISDDSFIKSIDKNELLELFRK